jgi:hypothetical protein
MVLSEEIVRSSCWLGTAAHGMRLALLSSDTQRDRKEGLYELWAVWSSHAQNRAVPFGNKGEDSIRLALRSLRTN